jgi:hypothetical protein
LAKIIIGTICDEKRGIKLCILFPVFLSITCYTYQHLQSHPNKHSITNSKSDTYTSGNEYSSPSPAAQSILPPVAIYGAAAAITIVAIVAIVVVLRKTRKVKSKEP